ncbi:MAG: hypothetical protein FWH34_04265 [Desulfovibrionaceae bacterium]|nr:hypothetical protein [Desulfovibrionaceae bacterium]
MKLKLTLLKKVTDPIVCLFWKVQIRILRTCPPLCGAVVKDSLGAANSFGVWMKTLLRITAQIPYALYLHWRNKRRNRVVLSRFSIAVTMRCTLNCDKCLIHIPDLELHNDVSACDLICDIQALFSCVDYIYVITLSGGEAFLHPDLDKIIQVCAESGKVGDICVQTNGTVIPGTKALAALRHAKATVQISKYSQALQPDVDTLKNILRINGICYTHLSSSFWRDKGVFGQLQSGSEKRRFSVCIQQLCFPCINGKLFLCSESALLIEAGLIPDCQDDYIDLRSACLSPYEFRKQWEKMLKKRAVSACSYCLGITHNTRKIPVAAQRYFDRNEENNEE